jgi:hypothetical protein
MFALVCVLLAAALVRGEVLFELPAAAFVVGAEASGAALLLQTPDRQSGYTIGVEAINGSLLAEPRLAVDYALVGLGNASTLTLTSRWPQGAVRVVCTVGASLVCSAAADGPLALLVIAAQDYDARASTPQTGALVGDLDGRALWLRATSGTVAVAGPRTLRLVGDAPAFTVELENAHARAALVYGVYVSAFVLLAGTAVGVRLIIIALTPPEWSSLLSPI